MRPYRLLDHTIQFFLYSLLGKIDMDFNGSSSFEIHQPILRRAGTRALSKGARNEIATNLRSSTYTGRFSCDLSAYGASYYQL